MRKLFTATIVAMALLCTRVIAQSPEALKIESSITLGNSTFHLSNSDTVILYFKTGEAIYIYGIPNQQMHIYADTISQILKYLATDFQAAETLPEDATRALYLYNGKAKRRLKVEDPEYTQRTFDTQDEVFRLQNQLARLKIQVISLPHNFELAVYVHSYSSFVTLIQSPLFERYISELENPKYFSEKSNVSKSSTSIKLSLVNDEMSVNANSHRRFVIQGNTNAGPMLIGGDLGAMFSVDLYYTQFNKHNQNRQRIGMNLTTGTFYSINQESRNGRLNMIQVYNLYYMRKYSEKYWTGFQVGMAHILQQRAPIFVPKISLLSEFNRSISWSWDIYLASFSSSQQLDGLFSGFTLRLPL